MAGLRLGALIGLHRRRSSGGGAGAPSTSSGTANAAGCARQIMSLHYGEALQFDNTGGPGTVRMQKTAELLAPECATDAEACVPSVVAAGIAYAPPRGRAEALAAFERTSACSK